MVVPKPSRATFALSTSSRTTFPIDAQRAELLRDAQDIRGDVDQQDQHRAFLLPPVTCGISTAPTLVGAAVPQR